jgi:site-specific recombinase XerD
MMKAQNETLRADRAMVAMLLGCGLRRSELLSLTMKTIQQRQAPLSGSPAKRISERKLYSFITFYFYVLSLEYPQALSSSI